jgi:hypothetical protein
MELETAQVRSLTGPSNASDTVASVDEPTSVVGTLGAVKVSATSTPVPDRGIARSEPTARLPTIVPSWVGESFSAIWQKAPGASTSVQVLAAMTNPLPVTTEATVADAGPGLVTVTVMTVDWLPISTLPNETAVGLAARALLTRASPTAASPTDVTPRTTSPRPPTRSAAASGSTLVVGASSIAARASRATAGTSGSVRSMAASSAVPSDIPRAVSFTVSFTVSSDVASTRAPPSQRTKVPSSGLPKPPPSAVIGPPSRPAPLSIPPIDPPSKRESGTTPKAHRPEPVTSISQTSAPVGRASGCRTSWKPLLRAADPRVHELAKGGMLIATYARPAGTGGKAWRMMAGGLKLSLGVATFSTKRLTRDTSPVVDAVSSSTRSMLDCVVNAGSSNSVRAFFVEPKVTTTGSLSDDMVARSTTVVVGALLSPPQDENRVSVARAEAFRRSLVRFMAGLAGLCVPSRS